MKKIVYILFILSFQFVAFAGNADRDKSTTKIVAGKVIDASGDALAGARIVVRETGETFFADLEGNFKIVLTAGKVYSIEVENIGYQPKEIKSSELSLFSELSLTEL